MDNPNELLDCIETAGLWAYFHKDWLLEIRKALRPQLPAEYQLFVESESIQISSEEVEVDTKYSLLIRRARENRIVAALEIVSPTCKGASSRHNHDKFVLKRDGFLEAGVSYLEIDALRKGPRVLPPALTNLAAFDRNAWTAFQFRGQRRVRGCGWNTSDSFLPVVTWTIEENLHLTVDFAATLQSASEFNRWPQLV